MAHALEGSNIMFMNQEELYSIGLLSGLSNAVNGENRIEARRSAYGVIKFAAESLSGFGIFKDLITSIGRSSQWSSITWDRKELSGYLDSVELGTFNYHHFAMGCIDAGFILSGCYSSERPHVKLETSDQFKRPMAEFIEGSLGPLELSGEYFGVDALDLMGLIYANDCDYAYSKSVEALDRWKTQIDGITNNNKPKFFFSRTRCDAVEPFKARISDSGFDLTLLEKAKSFGDVDLYHTGIKAYPAYGWYFMLVPRSSIIKSGYMLANNCGIIDRSYTGEILVPLVKVDVNAPDIELPCRLVQLIPQPIIDFDFRETEDDLDSSRGEKGFGSSGR
jgi:dUTP pyrophosphatase